MMGVSKQMLMTAALTIGILYAVKKFAPTYYPLA